jgi:hypothetical protein
MRYVFSWGKDKEISLCLQQSLAALISFIRLLVLGCYRIGGLILEEQRTMNPGLFCPLFVLLFEPVMTIETPDIVTMPGIPIILCEDVALELVVVGVELLVVLSVDKAELLVRDGFEVAGALNVVDDANPLEIEGLGLLDAIGKLVLAVLDLREAGTDGESSKGISSSSLAGLLVGALLMVEDLAVLLPASLALRCGRSFNILSKSGVPIPVTGSHPGTASQPAFSIFGAFQPEYMDMPLQPFDFPDVISVNIWGPIS